MGDKWATIPPVTVRETIRHGKTYWCVDWRTEGRRQRRYFRHRAEAYAFARELEAQQRRLGSAWAGLSAADRHRLLEAWRMATDAGADLLEAVQRGLEAMAAARRPPPPPLCDAVAAMLEAKAAAGVRPRYLTQLRWSTRRILAAFERVPVDRITTEDIEAWLARQRWAVATRRSVLADMRTLFAYCQRRRWIERNPVDAVERPRPEDRPPCILTPAEARRLLETARREAPEVLAYLAIGLFAGLRPAELDRLRWDEVQPERGFIEVKAAKAKSRRRRLVTVEPVLAAWLELAPRSGPMVRPTNFDRRWRRLRRLAGVRWGHDIIRHSFASYHLAHFRNPGRTALELGHADQEMLFRHYREVVTPEAAADWWALRPAESV